MNIDKLRISSFLPYKVTKRINKTGEARSGNGIYKKRNSRSYRVLIQYETWKQLIDKTEILKKYNQGYAVIIKPKDYFGENFPEKSKDLDSRFEIGETGFILYTTIDEIKKYPIKEEWIDKENQTAYDLSSFKSWTDVLELTTKGSLSTKTWNGEYCLNVRNSKKQLVSYICKTTKGEKEEKEYINFFCKNFSNYRKNIPKQCGLGNFDYDYADETMIQDVKLQMLYLLLCSRSSNNLEFVDYILENYETIKHNEDTTTFKNKIENQENFKTKFSEFFSKLKTVCEERKLLDFENLKTIGAWSSELNRPVCPLCLSEIYTEDFFSEILQDEGRQVADNTQREIVLMHIKALRPGCFNHKTYNLGWGHNFCNLIQGNKDIEETIEKLEEIIKTHSMSSDTVINSV